MPRRRYYYRRTVRPKQKWAINTTSSNVTTGSSFSIAAGKIGTLGTNVCTNSTRIETDATSLTSAAQILKTGRWKFKGVIPSASANVTYLIYLVYVPEGYYSSDDDYQLSTTGSDIFYRHPEWVLAWTRKDYLYADQNNEVSLTSRLKRNLNPGDSIQLRVLFFNNTTSTINVTGDVTVLRGTVSYCCRAN